MTVDDLLRLLEANGSVLRDTSAQPHPLSQYLAEARLQAESWRQAGVRRGNLVVVEGLSGIPLLRAILATWSLGAVPFPCDELSGEAFVGSTFRFVGESIGPLQRGDPDVRLNGTAILHRTSGSTGRYRLVRRSAMTLVAEARRYQDALFLTDSDRILTVLPIRHSFGWGFLLGGLLSGCHVDLRQGFSPVQTAKEVDQGHISVLGLTPPMAWLLVSRPGLRPHCPPRLVVVGAGPVDEELEKAFEARFGVGLARNYGSTETGATFSGEPGLASGVIGHPMSGVNVLEPPPGSRGELILELNPPVDGYLDGEPTACWWTGDLVERDLAGRVRVLGRLGRQLRVNGRNLDRARIEAVLLAYPGVEEVYLLARPRPRAPQVEDLVAVAKGLETSTEALMRYCLNHLPPSHCPSRIVLCQNLPKTEIGKPHMKEIVRLVERYEQRPKGEGETSPTGSGGQA